VFPIVCPAVTLDKASSAECQTCGTRQRRLFAECQNSALGEDNDRQLYTAPDGPLPRATLHQVFGTRQRNLCRVCSYAESPALGKSRRYREQDFAECGTRPDKKHSAKTQIPVVKEATKSSLRSIEPVAVCLPNNGDDLGFLNLKRQNE
jgi:hypothetical protein